MKNILIILLISFTSLSMASYVSVILNRGDITFKNLKPSDNSGTEVVPTEQKSKIMASDGTSFDKFGYSVSISGDVSIIGSYGDDNKKGAAYVFKNTGSEWIEVAKLTASIRSNGDEFGSSVSISGDVAIIGAKDSNEGVGAAYVFKNTGSEWVEVSKLTPSDDLAAQFGNSIVISGDVAIIGAKDSNGETGAAYVFKNTGSEWVEITKLTTSLDNSSYFGSSVAISGNTAIIGAEGANAAYVFKNNGSEWVEITRLTASVDNRSYFGASVAISGDTVMVGAYSDEDSYVYIFKDTGSEWVEVDKLKLKEEDYTYYEYGPRIAISGNTAIVTAPGYFDFEDGEPFFFKGAAYVYKNNGEKWIETAQIKANDGKSFDLFGLSVAMSGNTVILGAMGVVVVENENSIGAAYIFEPE